LEWHHIAVTGAPEDRAVQYFVDGKATGGGNLNLSEFPEEDFESHIFIGLDGRADGEFGVFMGIVDEFGVYNRVLEEAEVNQSFKAETGLAVDPNGKLAATWGAIKARQ
jgi:hypothetical protein